MARDPLKVPRGGGQNWSYNTPVDQPGNPILGGIPEPVFRDIMDARRSMYQRIPEAEYPDGYLGSITSRRGDRLLDRMKSKLGDRQYSRGVHKGERIDPGDYFWSPEFNMESGIRRQMVSNKRYSPASAASGWPQHLTDGDVVHRVSSGQDVEFVNTTRSRQLDRLRPPWR